MCPRKSHTSSPIFDVKDGHTREHLNTRLEQWRQQRAPFTLIMLDVGRMKEFNELFLHTLGDALLELITERLNHDTRAVLSAAYGDTPPEYILRRYGGDEYSIVIAAIDAPLVARLKKCVSHTMTHLATYTNNPTLAHAITQHKPTIESGHCFSTEAALERDTMLLTLKNIADKRASAEKLAEKTSRSTIADAASLDYILRVIHALEHTTNLTIRDLATLADLHRSATLGNSSNAADS